MITCPKCGADPYACLCTQHDEPTPETDAEAATGGFELWSLCEKLERDRNRLRARLAGVETILKPMMYSDFNTTTARAMVRQVIHTLNLTEAPKQEPVAWWRECNGGKTVHTHPDKPETRATDWEPLYSSPQAPDEKAREDTERIAALEKLGPADNMPYFFNGAWRLWSGSGPEEETFNSLRAAIDKARAGKGGK